jgi:hypothetical protein
MSNTSVTTGGAPPLSLPARFLGIITAPKETFASVAAHPRWLGMLLTVTIIISVCAALPMTTEAGKEAALRQQVEQRESWGMPVSDQQYEGLRRTLPFMPYFAGVSVAVFGPIMTLVMSGIVFLVFNVVLGGDRTFKQTFAVFAHAGVISALGQLFTGPLNYFRGEITSATNLAVLLPAVDEKSFIGRAMSMIDLFLIWYVLVLAIGLGVLYRRRTQPIAWSLYGVYAVIVLVAATVMTALGGK